MKRLRTLCCFAIVGMSMPAVLHADAANETRLRDQLRQTMLELRQAQDQNSELQVKLSGAQAAAPQAAQAPKSSRADVERVRSEMKQESAKVQAELDDAKAQVASLLQQLNDAGAKLAAARATAATVDEATKRVADSQARVDACVQDNRELVDISASLLQRYHDMGVWEALFAKEPITGIGHARREVAVEKYRGLIVDRTVTTPPATAPGIAPANR